MTLRPRIKSDADLRLELARVRRARGLSQLDLDDLAGLQTGYVGKLECGSRRFGEKSLTAIMAALGVELALVHSKAAADKAESLEPTEQFEVVPKRLLKRKAGRKGALAGHGRRTKEERSALATKLNAVRWRKWRELKAMKEAHSRTAGNL